MDTFEILVGVITALGSGTVGYAIRSFINKSERFSSSRKKELIAAFEAVLAKLNTAQADRRITASELKELNASLKQLVEKIKDSQS